MVKFYIKNNIVIDHPNEIDKKRDINKLAIEYAKINNIHSKLIYGLLVSSSTPY